MASSTRTFVLALFCMTAVYTYLYSAMLSSGMYGVTSFQQRQDSVVDLRSVQYYYFEPRMDEEEMNSMKDILYLFRESLSRTNISYFLYGGSLLGSYRHHDLIPWDDDVDVIIPHAQIRDLYAALSSLQPRYTLDVWMSPWKLYRTPTPGATKCHKLRWSWPFLDIFFYGENGTHIWDLHSKYIRQYVFDKTLVFPLRSRPLGHNMFFPSPANTSGFLRTTYDVETCTSNMYNHRCERHTKSISVNCSLLATMYPFVRRHSTPSGCLEVADIIGSDKNRTVSRFLDRGHPC